MSQTTGGSKGVFTLIGATLAGWLVARFVFSGIRGIVVGPFEVLPGLPFVMLLLALVSDQLVRGRQHPIATAACIGVASDSICWWFLRPGANSAVVVSGPWDKLVFMGSVACLAFVLALLVLGQAVGRSQCVPSPGRPLRVAAFGAGTILIMLFIHRVGFILTKHLPNEERSMMVGGIELHHAVLGSAILIVVGILLVTGVIRMPIFGMVVVGVCAGMILDQVTYIALREVTDLAYDGRISWAGAIVGGTVGMLFLLRLPANRNAEGG